MDTLDKVVLDIRTRMAELEVEHQRLARAEQALIEAGLLNPPTQARRKARAAVTRDAEAPYGRKRDGSPRKRPGRLKAVPTPEPKREEIRLSVQTMGMSRKELEDREVAHVTQEPK